MSLQVQIEMFSSKYILLKKKPVQLSTQTTTYIIDSNLYLPGAAIRYGCKKHKPKSDDDDEEEAVTEAETVTEE